MAGPSLRRGEGTGNLTTAPGGFAKLPEFAWKTWPLPRNPCPACSFLTQNLLSRALKSWEDEQPLKAAQLSAAAGISGIMRPLHGFWKKPESSKVPAQQRSCDSRSMTMAAPTGTQALGCSCRLPKGMRPIWISPSTSQAPFLGLGGISMFKPQL